MTDATNLERAAWGLAILAFVPALMAMSGFIVAGAIAVGIIGLFYGGRRGLRIYEQQNVGKKAGRLDMNSTLTSDDRNWGRK